MKKLLVIFTMIFVSMNMYAQNNGNGKGKGNNKQEKQEDGKSKKQTATPEERATRMSGKFKNELNLNDDQANKLKEITTTRITKMDEIRDLKKSNKEDFRAKRKAIFQAWEADLKTILTPEQYTTYLSKKEERIKKRQEKREEKKESKDKKGGNKDAKKQGDDGSYDEDETIE